MTVDALRALPRDTIDDAHVDLLRTAYLDRMQRSLATTSGVLAWLRWRWWNGLACDAPADLVASTASLTVASIAGVADALLAEGAFHIVVVGDAALVRPDLDRAGFITTDRWR